MLTAARTTTFAPDPSKVNSVGTRTGPRGGGDW
jgi:hypothetical protein